MVLFLYLIIFLMFIGHTLHVGEYVMYQHEDIVLFDGIMLEKSILAGNDKPL